MLFAWLLLCGRGEDVCGLLSYDPDTCISVFGCGYCVETARCYALYESGKPTNSCPSATVNSFNKPAKKLGRCFSLYSDDGCQKCVARELGVNCGWCQSLGVCAEGTPAGPDAFECSGSDWLFNKSTCDRSTCASAKTKASCRMPCVWSTRGVCLLPANLSNADVAQEKDRNIAFGKRMFLGVAILGCVIGIVAIVVLAWKWTRPLYKQLPMMNEEYTLNDLPAPVD